MISRILVALDHTDRARGVLAMASEIAERFDAELFLFRAIALVQDFPAAASNAGHSDPLPAYLRLEAIGDLESLAVGNTRAAAHAPIVIVGAPARTILQAADQVDADLIVIGSHGVHGLERVLGTTTGTIANRARRNVLVVHADS